MKKKLLSIRASSFTRNQLEKLADFTGMSKTEIISIAINNMCAEFFFFDPVYKHLKKEILKNLIDKEEISEIDERILIANYEWARKEMRIDPVYLNVFMGKIKKCIE